jgi:NADPH:quinone reductase-like Zn-dependent oxidoreductase
MGTFAESAVVNASLAMRRPADIDALTAAAIPTAGVTACQALTAVGHPKPGQRVLVIGASGGIGSFVVQLAAASSAATAVVGTRNVELARALGAAEVIDHTTTDVTARHRHHDLIVDLAGVHPLGDLQPTPHLDRGARGRRT